MAYNPRLTEAGMANNPKWYSRQNPFYPTYGLPNCTCYAWGRFWEIADPTGLSKRPHLPTGNGNQWYGQVVGYTKNSSVPKLGSVICFGGASPGHVAIVEEIKDNGNTIVTSNSDWKGRYFYLETLTRRSDGKFRHPHKTKLYLSQGFIYNPYADQTPSPSPSPTPTPSGKTKLNKKFPWPVAWEHWDNFKA